jgi:hypothetical protein
MIAVFTCVGVVMTEASMASAGQNTVLYGQIVKDPIPDGVALSALDETVVNSQLRAEAPIAKKYGYRVAGAIEFWREQESSKKVTEVALLAFTLPSSSSSVSDIAAFARVWSAASSSVCVSETGSPPVTNVPFRSLPDGHEIRCAPLNGTNLVVVSFAKGSVVADVTSTIFDQAQLLTLAKQQYDKLTVTGESIAASGSFLAIPIRLIVWPGR